MWRCGVGEHEGTPGETQRLDRGLGGEPRHPAHPPRLRLRYWPLRHRVAFSPVNPLGRKKHMSL